MNRRAILLRETLLSAAINAAIAAALFFALFGLAQPVAAGPYGRDFLPQSFMVGLMGSLIPGLLLRRTHGGSARGVVVRALLLALGALGLGAVIFVAVRNGPPIAAPLALAIKLAHAVVLSAVVTPIAVRAVLNAGRRPLA